MLFKLTTGVRAVVTDEEGHPLREGAVKIGTTTHKLSPNMAYFKKVLLPGSYVLEFSCKGYISKTVTVVINDNTITNVNVQLQQSKTRGEVKLIDQKPKTKQPGEQNENASLNGMNLIIDELNGKYPRISRMHTIGVNSRGATVMAIEIGIQNDKIELAGRPSIVFSAGVGRGAPVTSETLATFATYLLSNYKKDPEVTDYLERFAIYIAPDLNPGSDKTLTCSPARGNDTLSFPIEGGLSADASMIVEWFKLIDAVFAVNLKSGSRHVEFPYAANDTSGLTLNTQDEKIFKKFASAYTKTDSWLATSSRRCDEETAGQAISGTAKDSLMNYLYANTSTLMIDAYITCCNTDHPVDVWDENRMSLLATIKEIDQGVTGYVVTETDEPIVNAVLTYDKSEHKIVNSKSGAYWLLLLAGSHTITAEASGYIPETKLISTPDLKKFSHLMFKLRRDESILGMPRLVFIIISG